MFFPFHNPLLSERLKSKEISKTEQHLPALHPLHRVLLRVRMLYYLKVEVLGDAAGEAQEGISAR